DPGTEPTDPADPTDPTSTTEPDPTTTEPSSTTTTAPGADLPPLVPGEALVPVPEFASLTGHQRALVDALQRSTDAYALRRLALIDLARELPAAKEALAQARADEATAVTREIVELAEAGIAHADALPRASRRGRSREAVLDDRLDAFHTLKK